jgi:acetyl-CoA synthetase
MISEKNKIAYQLLDYKNEKASFSWENCAKELSGLPDGKGLNIAHEAVDRHAESHLKHMVALRFIRKDNSVDNVTYSELKSQTSKFANLLKILDVKKGERIFSLTGRIAELYITALGTLKHSAVFCPLFSVFGPEPIFQRLSRGDATVLVTTSLLYEKKVKQILERLPSLRYIIITDATEHISVKVLSFSKLMQQAKEDYDIPETSPEDAALLHFTSGTTGMPKGVLHVHQAVLTHYVTGKYVLDFHEGDRFWCTADPGWVTGTSYGIIAPLVNGVTSIIDEAEFDAINVFILKNIRYNLVYSAYCNKAIDANGYKTTRKIQARKSTADFECGRASPCRSRHLGSEKFWCSHSRQLVADRNWRHHDSQLSLDGSKTRLHGETITGNRSGYSPSRKQIIADRDRVRYSRASSFEEGVPFAVPNLFT